MLISLDKRRLFDIEWLPYAPFLHSLTGSEGRNTSGVGWRAGQEAVVRTARVWACVMRRGGRARENRKFIQVPSPEIWSETISGGEEALAGKWGGLFLGYLLGKNFWRHDRDHLIPAR